ncbi:glycosyltransferase family 2 protein [Actibacterium pelagium]|uniref:Glycosyltransferase 2-like domain-containing protein n=1 Tax=Actibacterium pelagium TaxID=2029103 RepID=A0A917AB60_9RHOB|nr:glycosyltransferase family 2 protein [Actibacterium pelagium]GGE39551.1 hypothetical protein GCM10011517_04070 [Actibacterium pelagium]
MQQLTEEVISAYSDNGSVPHFAPINDELERPKISVITACFNAAALLEETVNSVAEQSFKDIEHIIVDGDSHDETVTYLETLNPPIKWTSEPDDGIADAMNKGVSMARGDWVIVLHAGDTFEGSRSLEILSESFAEATEIITCGINYGSGGEHHPLVISSPIRRLDFKTIYHQGSACRRKVFEIIGGFDSSFKIAMDYEFFLRARKSGCRFFPTNQILSRMDDTGLSSQKDWPSLRRRFAEERRAQMAHCESIRQQAIYAVYWPVYHAYRRLRSAVTGG